MSSSRIPPGTALERGGAVVTRNGQGFHTDTTMSQVKELVGHPRRQLPV